MWHLEREIRLNLTIFSCRFLKIINLNLKLHYSIQKYVICFDNSIFAIQFNSGNVLTIQNIATSSPHELTMEELYILYIYFLHGINGDCLTSITERS